MILLKNIEAQFNLIAEEYDSNRKKFIPCFDDFYRHSTKFIVSNIAKPERILDLGAGTDNVSYLISDYSKELPDGDFDIIMSALSVHHLENKEKAELFENIYNKLPKGGLFINYDQFCAGQTEMNVWFDSYWEKQLADSELTDSDIELWKERRKLDRECSVEEEMEMLYKCRFKTVKCIYSYQKFSVIIAIK